MGFFSKHSDKEYAALEKKCAALELSLAAEKKKVVEAEARLSDANRLIKAEGDAKINEVQSQKAELDNKLADLIAAASKLTSELEAKAAETQKIKSELEAKAAETQRIKSELEAKAAEAQNLVSELLRRQADEADLKSENDLLLAQLHQVQEELEKYYLDNKELEAAISDSALDFKRTRFALVNHLTDTRGYVVPVAPKARAGGNRASKPREAASTRKSKRLA